MRISNRTLLISALTSVLTTFSMSHQVAAQISHPTTRKVEHVDTYHGEKVADPYRWLEDDNSAETKAWVVAQNEVTRKYLDALPKRADIQQRYTALYNFEKYSTPWKEGGRYFWSRNDGLQQQYVHYVADSLTAAPRVLLDPNTLSKDGTVSVAFTSVSRDGKRLAYGLSSAGSDWTEIRVRDIDSGKDLPDRIQWVKFSSAEWSADGQGFFYGAYDAPKPGEKLTGQNYFQKLYYHQLGTPQSKDVLVYERKDQKEWGFAVTVAEDAKHHFLFVWRGSERKNGLLWAPAGKGSKAIPKANDFRTLTLDFDASYEVIGSRGNSVWVKTNLDAPLGRVIEIDLARSDKKHWKTVVAESKQTLESASVVGGVIVAQYLRDARSVVERFSLDGKSLGEVALPGVGSAGGFGGKLRDPETFFAFTSMTEPSTIFRYDVAKNQSSVFRKPKIAFDSAKYETKQAFVTSKDGTQVPIFIAQRKDIKLDGNNPVIVSAYGGFGVSTTPSFRVTAATWMDMGGVFVEAAIRGGGEYGKAWHDAAKGAKRQNAYDDFIAVAEWLAKTGYSKPEKIGVTGGSNGGLLIGAVVNQRPDVFGAAVPEVGVMDMLRFHKFTIGWAWVDEYGSSDKAEDFAHLKRISPLHNIRSGVKYPPILVMTADHDDRVVPAHSFKYAATLQATDTGNAPKLIRIQTSAGHGAGTPTSKIIEERSDVLAFFAHSLKM